MNTQALVADSWGGRRERVWFDRLAYGIVVLFTAFVLFFGWKFHRMESAGGPENDGYVAKAEALQRGEIPADPFRPLLYPLLAARAGAVLDDTFAGARLVSQLAAGWLALLTYWLGRCCFGRAVGVLALLGVVTNYTVISSGVYAATDMLFAAFTAWVLLLLCREDAHWPRRSLVVLGLAFALAYFTRYTAVALIPSVIVALAWGRPLLDRVTAHRLLLFAAVAALFLVPHFVLTTKALGHPFYNENWKNLAFKLYGGGDWEYYARIPYDGLFAVILADPGRVIGSAVEEVVRFFSLLPVVSGNFRWWTPTGILILAAFLLGSVGSLAALDRKKAVLLTFILVYVGMVSLFYAWRSRLLLPVLPVAFILAGYAIRHGLVPWIRTIRPGRAGWVLPLLGGVLLVSQTGPLAWKLRKFVLSHPVAEVAAARELEALYGREVRVLSTFALLPRYVGYSAFFLRDAVGEEVRDKERYYARLLATVERLRPDYLVIGRATLGRRPADLLFTSDVPPALQLVSRSADVVVYRVQLEAPAPEQMSQAVPATEQGH